MRTKFLLLLYWGSNKPELRLGFGYYLQNLNKMRIKVAGGHGMTPDRALDYLNDMLWSAALVAGPVMLATLLVGLLVSVFQVATQIQEITLSYVPKIMVAGLMLILLGPWMIAQLTSFARDLYLTIPTFGS